MTATPEQVLATVREAVELVLEVPAAEVGRDTRFVEDLRADSLALVEIADLLEERFAPIARRPLRIEDADLDDISTVGEAVDYLVARL